MISFIKDIFLIYIYRVLEPILFKYIYKFIFVLWICYQCTLYLLISQRIYIAYKLFPIM